MNLQYPVPLSSGSIRHSHPVVILGMDIKSDLVPCDLLVRENANQMSGDGSAVLPARCLRQLLGVRVQFGRRDLRMLLKILLAAGKRLFDVAAEFSFERIVAYNVGPAEICLPFLEHRAEVEKDNVVLTNREVWRIFIIGSQSVRSGAHNAFVPVAGDAEHALGKRVDALINFAFLRSWPNQVLRLDGRE